MERDHLEDPCVDGRIILKWILKKRGGGMGWIDLAQDRAKLVDIFGCGNEPPDYIKCGKFLENLRNC